MEQHWDWGRRRPLRSRWPQLTLTRRDSDLRIETAHRLPDPHLTRQVRLFRVAHHDGLQPTQHTVVWNLPP